MVGTALRTFAHPTAPAFAATTEKLRRVIRLLAIQHPLQRIEMPLGRGRALVEMIVPVIALGLFDHGGRKLLQFLSRPHCVDLHLGGALDVLEHVVGFRDGRADRGDAVVGHEQHFLVADHAGQPRAFGGIERRAGVFIIIGDGA